MWIFLFFLSSLCVNVVYGLSGGICPRKDPPPGVLVLSPGSHLVLTCSGDVAVDGVKVNVEKERSSNRKDSSAFEPTTALNITHTKRTADYFKNDSSFLKTGVRTARGESKNPRNTDTNSHTSPPTTLTALTTRYGKGVKGRADALEDFVEGDYEEEDDDEEEGGEEGRRVTRGIKSRFLWKWNGKHLGAEGRDWTEVMLSLFAVREADTGRYTCYRRGRERFSLKVIISEPLETPTLSCYKKSPSSKIRCEWQLERPLSRPTNCYLMLRKSLSESFIQIQCSYSSRLSRCWCALDHNQDKKSLIHTAYLCVSSVTGNATSNVLTFIPMDIIIPDPPSNVSVTAEEGYEKWLKITWNLPSSWKPQDKYYELIYEVKYRPLQSSFNQDQINLIRGKRFYIITDAMPGVEYLIQLRTKEEFQGQWSDWSTPVYASSWKAPNPWDNFLTTEFPSFEEEGSAVEDDMSDGLSAVTGGMEASYHILWICSLFLLLVAILAGILYRHKKQILSKLNLSRIVNQSSESTQPAVLTPAAPEGQALVTFLPPCHKEPPITKARDEEMEEEDEEEEEEEETEAMHFNNHSYFWTQTG